MALDGIILSKIKENLDNKLPIRINKISESSKTEIVFNIHANNIRTNLVVSLHPNDNRLSLSNKTYNDFSEPSTFVMVLRKYLINGIITSIDQINYDRYLIFTIKALDELYDDKTYLLSIELMGKYANIILVDKENNKIIDAYKKIPPYENTKRTILVGANFELIESQDKKDPFKIDSPNLDESLVKELQGFSKLLELEVRYRLNKQSYKEIMSEIKDSTSLYISGNDYHVIPLTHLNKPIIQKELNDGFDYLFYQKSQLERIKSVTDDISKFIKRQLKHYETKLIKLNNSLDDALNLEIDKQNGDLLYLYPNLDEKGLKEVKIIDYDNNSHLVKTDPKLSIKQNANKYYQIYSKKRKGKVFITEQIEICQNEINYFEGLLEQLDIASYSDGIEIKEELYKYGYLKKKNNNLKKKKKINLYQVNYKGYLITWGKNNIQNDHLTFDYSKPNHTYFHAQKYHGSHVTVNSSDLDEDVIRMAANIAAYNSKGRYSSSVPVDYCLVKDVKKVKGAKIGFVTIRNQKTIYIDPEEIDLEIKNI